MVTNSFLSTEATKGIVLGYFEARLAQELSEENNTWDTLEGRQAEAAMGHLRMALEAMGFAVNAKETETAYKAYKQENR